MNQRFVQTNHVFDFILDMPSWELTLRLMEEILHHPGMYKTLWIWEKLPTSTGAGGFFHQQYPFLAVTFKSMIFRSSDFGGICIRLNWRVPLRYLEKWPHTWKTRCISINLKPLKTGIQLPQKLGTFLCFPCSNYGRIVFLFLVYRSNGRASENIGPCFFVGSFWRCGVWWGWGMLKSYCLHEDLILLWRGWCLWLTAKISGEERKNMKHVKIDEARLTMKRGAIFLQICTRLLLDLLAVWSEGIETNNKKLMSSWWWCPTRQGCETSSSRVEGQQSSPKSACMKFP